MRKETNHKNRIYLIVALALGVLLLISGCSNGRKPAVANEIILATTTSTYDTGLLDRLLPAFTERHGYKVKPLAVGTGEALLMGKRGDADVLLVHAPEAEEVFMAAGGGRSRRAVMYNWFLLVGPEDDPADVKEMNSVTAALEAIAETGSPFISRGDDSGTHKKEVSLWRTAGLEPAEPWYREVGQGMGATLRVADEKEAYTLTDEATFQSQRESLSLRAFKLDDPGLRNKYSVIVIDHKRPDVGNYEGARAFARWLVGPQGRSLIADFRIPGDGKALFVPAKK